jgi:hypothetical protein
LMRKTLVSGVDQQISNETYSEDSDEEYFE